MPDTQLPPGLVMWTDAAGTDHQIAVLISDIHCTDCTVGNQTADETDWENYFRELEVMLDASVAPTSEVLLILNGDVVDLLRSGKWAAANVYPWQRDKPEFRRIVLDIMHDIVEMHAQHPVDENNASGFFHYLQDLVQNLRKKISRVSIIPTVGNHDKELQVVPEARAIYYQQCLGLTAEDLNDDYRNWVAAQMGSDPKETWPLLPFYFADPHLRLFATHGQWRDSTNSRATRLWSYCKGWQPQLWQQEQYQPFSDPCFGDTIASGLLSHFIWNATRAIVQDVIPRAVNRSRDDGIDHILNVLREMDLYRPSASAVVRLLQEARKLDLSDQNNRRLYQTVVDQYRNSLQTWLAHPETFGLASLLNKVVMHVISFLSHLHWAWLDTALMRLMAWASDMNRETPFAKLPAFLAEYRLLGFRLHAEGHTHDAMEADLRYNTPREHRNYTYVNLGAWRNRIVQKVDNLGFRRRSIGRALIVRSGAVSAADGDYGFTLRDITSWGDRLDRW